MQSRRKHIERSKEQHKKLYHTNPEYRKRVLEYNKKWREKNKEHLRGYKKRKYHTDPEYKKKIMEWNKKYIRKKKLHFVKIPKRNGGIEKVYVGGLAQQIQKQLPQMMNKIAIKLLKKEFVKYQKSKKKIKKKKK